MARREKEGERGRENVGMHGWNEEREEREGSVTVKVQLEVEVLMRVRFKSDKVIHHFVDKRSRL